MNINRILGVIMLRAPVYREIADDQAATTEAAIVFVVCTLISGFFDGLVNSSGNLSFGGAIGGAIGGLVVGAIGWVFTSWVLSFVAKQLDGKTSFSEMLRVTGYVSVFTLVSVLSILRVIPALGCLTTLIAIFVWLLSLVGYLIGVREAAEFTTGKAIITAIVAGIVRFVIVVLIGGVVIGAIAGLFLLAGAVH